MINQCRFAMLWDGNGADAKNQIEFITGFKYLYSPRWGGQPLLPQLLAQSNPIVLESKTVISQTNQEYCYQSRQGSAELRMTTQQKTVSNGGVYTYCTIHKCLLRVKCNQDQRCFQFQPREMLEKGTEQIKL
jgi:hypothetical protein